MDGEFQPDIWQLYADHRKRITHLLARVAPQESNLCVLGAGNCNDINLRSLRGIYREVDLVDCDARAVAAGVIKQFMHGDPGIRCHVGIDVTGMAARMAHWSPSAIITNAEVRLCREEPSRSVRSAIPGSFNVVASTCLLSQLIAAVMKVIGDGHPRFLELTQAIRAAHLDLLGSLVTQGGIGVLITDIVSSDTFPALSSVSEVALPAVIVRLVSERNFFHGVNPLVLLSLLQSQACFTDVKAISPWRWNAGPRVYAVCAFIMTKTC